MKLMNQTVRQAFFDVVGLIERAGPQGDPSIDYLIDMIPDYWEIPGDGRRIA
jgi:hypothetical protein